VGSPLCLMGDGLAPELIDLLHLGRQRVIGAWRVDDVIVDPGPASCLPVLLDALDGEAPRALALTHIHLDHAGASGSLVRRFPDLEVWVHERSAPHMVDPVKLIASAGRLYGERMQQLWGEILPVPPDRLRILSGGERVGGFEVAYTPGHASHHVSYLHQDSGQAFTGDVAGARIGDQRPVLAPTPPPDIDLEAWRASLEIIEAWRPTALAPTHFGVYRDVERHLMELRSCLERFEHRARTLDESQFAERLRADVSANVDLDTAAVYEQAMPPDQTYAGLRRYLRRKL
jgi:glyoxylase-like metal-dependent hydrolase (beta-lactamase superfamily II)